MNRRVARAVARVATASSLILALPGGPAPAVHADSSYFIPAGTDTLSTTEAKLRIGAGTISAADLVEFKGCSAGDTQVQRGDIVGVPAANNPGVGAVGETNTTVLALCLVTTQKYDIGPGSPGSPDYLYVTLQSQRTLVEQATYGAGLPSVGALEVTFRPDALGGTFESSLNVNYDVRKGAATGPMVVPGLSSGPITADPPWSSSVSSAVLSPFCHSGPSHLHCVVDVQPSVGFAPGSGPAPPGPPPPGVTAAWSRDGSGGTSVGEVTSTCGRIAYDPFLTNNALTAVPSRQQRSYAEIQGVATGAGSNSAGVILTLCDSQPSWPDPATGDVGVAFSVCFDIMGGRFGVGVQPQIISFNGQGAPVYDGAYRASEGWKGCVQASFGTGQATAINGLDTTWTWLDPTGNSQFMDARSNGLELWPATWVGNQITFSIPYTLIWTAGDFLQQEIVSGQGLGSNVVATASVLVPIGIPNSVAPALPCVPTINPVGNDQVCLGSESAQAFPTDTFPGNEFCSSTPVTSCQNDGLGYDLGLSPFLPPGGQAATTVDPGDVIAPFVTAYDACLPADNWANGVEGASGRINLYPGSPPYIQDEGNLQQTTGACPSGSGPIIPITNSYAPALGRIQGPLVPGSNVACAPACRVPFYATNRFLTSPVSW